jgi:hypothetical protein
MVSRAERNEHLMSMRLPDAGRLRIGGRRRGRLITRRSVKPCQGSRAITALHDVSQFSWGKPMLDHTLKNGRMVSSALGLPFVDAAETPSCLSALAYILILYGIAYAA